MSHYSDQAERALSGELSLQVGGNHYESRIDPLDYISANKLNFMEGNIIKYVTRWRKKDGVTDLLKARDYLNRLIKQELK